AMMLLRALIAVCLLAGSAHGSGDSFYFSAWPESGRVVADEAVELRCAVSDPTSITLTWHLDQRALTYMPRRHLRGSDLVIERAVPEDAGEYTCIAHNTTSGFALTSLPATITILWVGEASRAVVTEPRNGEVRPGDALNLRCRVDG
ncbi:unnamed protein product, partial [Meganyctiphanes norvegica]